MLLFFFWFDKIVNIFPSWGVYVDGYGYILDAAYNCDFYFAAK